MAGVVLLLLALAGFLRLWRLDQVPPFFHFDEGNNGMDALSVLAGRHALFFPADRGREPMVIYAVAAFTAWLGPTMVAARLPAAIASVGAVLATCWVGTVILADKTASGMLRWRGFVLGSIAAGLLAVSLGQTILGRTGMRANLLPVLVTLALGLLWDGMQRRSLWRVGAAGFVTGLVAYTYVTSRFFPVLLLLFGLTFLFPLATAMARVRSYRRELLLFGAVALVTAAPMMGYFALHPGDFTIRSAEVWLFTSPLSDGNPLSTLARNISMQLSVLGFAGDPSWRSNYAERPLLNVAEAFFFWLGIVVMLWGWRKPANRLLLLWLVVFLTPAVLSYDLPRNTFRMLGMGPAIYLTVAVGMWALATWLSRRIWREPPHPRAPLFSAVIVTGLCMVGVRAVDTTQIYFDAWANEVEAHHAAPNVEWIDMMRLMESRPAEAGEVYIVPYNDVGEYSRTALRYLYHGVTPVHTVDTSLPAFLEEWQLALRQDNANQPVKVVKTMDWAREATADAPGRIPYLLGKYGRFQGSDERKYYRVDSYAELDLEQPWQLFDHLEPITVTFDGGVTLTGVAAGTHGGTQLTTQRALPVTSTADSPLWLALRWRADQAPKVDYRASLRLFDAAGSQVFQQDDVMMGAENQPSSQWQPGSSVESYHLIALPPDLAAGTYELRLIVYDEATLTPTVQVGVWTPEIELAQIEISP